MNFFSKLEKEKINTAIGENDKFDPSVHLRFKYSFERKPTQKTIATERLSESQRRDE